MPDRVTGSTPARTPTATSRSLDGPRLRREVTRLGLTLAGQGARVSPACAASLCDELDARLALLAMLSARTAEPRP